MKQSSKCAVGGIVASLSLVLMISAAVFPFLELALPAVAGALVVFMVVEVDKKWAFGVYATVAILGMLLVANKEVSVMYLAFFGYYPIFKAVIEGKLPNVLGWSVKIVSFVATMVAAYWLMMKFMGVTIDEMEEFGFAAIPMLLGLGAFAFIMYDIALTKFITLYMMKWRKYFKRYFK